MPTNSKRRGFYIIFLLLSCIVCLIALYQNPLLLKNTERYFSSNRLAVDWPPTLGPKERQRGMAPKVEPRHWLGTPSTRMFNRTCALFPTVEQIKWNNDVWQVLESSNGTFFLFGAYYDNRIWVGRPTVRLLGMVTRVEPQLSTFCQMWFAGIKKPAVVQVAEYKYAWNKAFKGYEHGVEQPHLLSCQVPDEYLFLVPELVSLVEKPCDAATTNLKVVNNRPPDGRMKDFAVCVKGLDFADEDKSVYFVEWLEALSLLGADQVFLYDLQLHPNIAKVLYHYKKGGFVDVTKLTLPGEQPNTPQLLHKFLKEHLMQKRLNEMIPYNDCLYKNIYRYKFVVLLDTDELIVPKNTSSWKALMKALSRKALSQHKNLPTTFSARNVYFLDSMQEAHGFASDIPRYMHLLQHVYRARNHTKPGAYAKCFHNTQRVLTLHNHFPIECLRTGCHNYPIPTEDAQLQHYRKDCVEELRKTCEEEFKVNTVLDTALCKYKEPLRDRVLATLMQLGFINFTDIRG